MLTTSARTARAKGPIRGLSRGLHPGARTCAPAPPRRASPSGSETPGSSPQLRRDLLAKGGAGRGPCEVLADSNRGNTGSGPQACPEVELRPHKSEVPVHKRVCSSVRSGGVSRPEPGHPQPAPGTQSRPRSPASRRGGTRSRLTGRTLRSRGTRLSATFVLCATQGD